MRSERAGVDENRMKHAGSNFDDFLLEEGLLADAEAVALKRVIAYQLSQAMSAEEL